MMAALIPDSFYAGLEAEWAWALWLLAAGAIAVLVAGADRVVGSSVRLAAVLGMSKVIIGATVVSLGTTTPEAFTSVTAAFEGKPGLALGNGVGSIICDTALIFGLACTITRLPLNRYVLSRHGWLQLGSGVLLTAVVVAGALLHGGIDGVVIPRPVGFAFVALLVGYLYLSVRWARQRPEILPEEVQTVQAVRAPGRPVRAALRNLLVLAAGLALVVVGANVLVGSAGALCHKYGVPQNVLAVTLVAFGTSLPELVTVGADGMAPQLGLRERRAVSERVRLRYRRHADTGPRRRFGDGGWRMVRHHHGDEWDDSGRPLQRGLVLLRPEHAVHDAVAHAKCHAESDAIAHPVRNPERDAECYAQRDAKRECDALGNAERDPL